MMILFYFPKVETNLFNEKYDNKQWCNNTTEFKA